DAVDHIHVAENNARPHAVNGVLSDDLVGKLQADVGQLGSLAAQGVEGDLEARQDHAPYIISLLIHHAHGGGSAHVDDHQGQRMLMGGGYRVHDHIASHSLGIVHKNIDAGLDSRTHQERADAE